MLLSGRLSGMGALGLKATGTRAWNVEYSTDVAVNRHNLIEHYFTNLYPAP